jgi:hypothetical protein
MRISGIYVGELALDAALTASVIVRRDVVKPPPPRRQRIQHLHTRAPAADETAVIQLIDIKASRVFAPRFFQHNLLRIVDDGVSVIKDSLRLRPALVEICYLQKRRKAQREAPVNNQPGHCFRPTLDHARVTGTIHPRCRWLPTRTHNSLSGGAL